MIGRLLSTTDSTLLIERARTRDTVRLVRAELQRVEVSRGSRVGKGMRMGALIGGAAGAMLGAIAGEDCEQDSFICFDRSETVPVGALGGMALGGLVGAIVGSAERWGPTSTDVRVAVVPAGGKALVLSGTLEF